MDGFAYVITLVIAAIAGWILPEPIGVTVCFSIAALLIIVDGATRAIVEAIKGK